MNVVASRTRLIAACAVVALGPARGLTQSVASPRVIDGTPRCLTCTIARTKLTTLASSGDSIWIDDLEVAIRSMSPTVHRDGLGRTYVDGEGGIAVYDSAGRLIHVLATPRMAGGRPGPTITQIWIGPGDSAFTEVQPTSGLPYRVVFDRNFQPARWVPFPSGKQGLLPLADGGAVFVPVHRSEDGIDTVFHVVDDRGADVRAFGGLEDERACPRCFRPRLFATVPNRSNEFWTLSPLDYRLQRWTTEGQLQSDFVVRGARWFDAGAPNSSVASGVFGAASGPTGPVIAGAFADDHGHLWVLGLVSASGSQPVDLSANLLYGRIGGVSTSRLPMRGLVLSDAAWAQVAANTTTVLDVIDTTTGSVLVSQRFEHEQLQFAAPGIVYVRRRAADGSWSIDLFRLSLQGFARAPGTEPGRPSSSRPPR